MAIFDGMKRRLDRTTDDVFQHQYFFETKSYVRSHWRIFETKSARKLGPRDNAVASAANSISWHKNLSSLVEFDRAAFKGGTVLNGVESWNTSEDIILFQAKRCHKEIIMIKSLFMYELATNWSDRIESPRVF